MATLVESFVALPAAKYGGALAFKPSMVMYNAHAAKMAAAEETREYMMDFLYEVAELPERFRTESELAERLAAAAKRLPKSQQMSFLEQAAASLEATSLIIPDPVPLAPEEVARFAEIKQQYQKFIMTDPFQRMMNNGCWSWFHAAEKEDEMFPEKKAERDARAAAAMAAEAVAEEERRSQDARAAEQAKRNEMQVATNKNPSLRLGNLYLGVSEDVLREHFGVYGKITRVNIPKNKETGDTRGFAFVDFASPAAAAAAYIALNETPLVLKKAAVRVEFAATELRSAPKGGAGRPAADGWSMVKPVRK